MRGRQKRARGPRSSASVRASGGARPELGREAELRVGRRISAAELPALESRLAGPPCSPRPGPGRTRGQARDRPRGPGLWRRPRRRDRARARDLRSACGRNLLRRGHAVRQSEALIDVKRRRRRGPRNRRAAKSRMRTRARARSRRARSRSAAGSPKSGDERAQRGRHERRGARRHARAIANCHPEARRPRDLMPREFFRRSPSSPVSGRDPARATPRHPRRGATRTQLRVRPNRDRFTIPVASRFACARFELHAVAGQRAMPRDPAPAASRLFVVLVALASAGARSPARSPSDGVSALARRPRPDRRRCTRRVRCTARRYPHPVVSHDGGRPRGHRGRRPRQPKRARPSS